MQERKNTLLLVDDEDEIRRMLVIFFDSVGFKVLEAESGKQATRMAVSTKPDVIVLDLGLPDMDGKDVVTAVRQWSQVPIIVLTARADDTEVTTLLNLGADDYVTKPFNADVLLARVNANLRKATVREAGQPDISNGPIRMDLVRHEVFVGQERVAFTPKEYDLLRYFLVHRGRMLTHKQILKEVWGAAHVDDTQYLRVYVGQLREKLELHPGLGKCIVSEAGIGYRMDAIAEND